MTGAAESAAAAQWPPPAPGAAPLPAMITAQAALAPGAAAKESPAGHYLVEVTDRVDPQLVASVTAWCAEHGVLAQDLRIESRTLEDVFLELTGRELRS